MGFFGAKTNWASGNTKCKQRTRASGPLNFIDFDGIATIRPNNKLTTKAFMRPHNKGKSDRIPPLSLETYETIVTPVLRAGLDFIDYDHHHLQQHQ